MKSFAFIALTTFAAATKTKDLYDGMPSYPDEFMPSMETFDYVDYSDFSYDSGSYGSGSAVPTGDFWNQVDDFNEWDTIWDQYSYEERLHEEADLMVALEALREALVELDSDIDSLEDCISDNDDRIDENDAGIRDNDSGIEENDDEISDQEDRVERLQRQCRRCQDDIDEDRDVMILYCQQFAFAPDMVGACADILTCSGTRLAYRADVFKN